MVTTDDLFLATKKYHKKFNAICEPLMRYFGLSGVTYFSMKNNTDLLNIHTGVKWMERCMSEHYYKQDPLMVHPDRIESGFAFYQSNDEYVNSKMNEDEIKFNFYTILAYVEKDKNSFEAFSLSAPKENTQFINKALSENKLLKQFIRYIQKHIRGDKAEMESFRMNFSLLKKDLFFSQEGLISPKPKGDKKALEALNAIGIDNSIASVSLSKQEKACLRLYVDNLSAKQTASYLELSYNTVLSYLENIKSKLNCHYKMDLIRKAEVLEAFGEI